MSFLKIMSNASKNLTTLNIKVVYSDSELLAKKMLWWLEKNID